jgi:hypothetical protein
VSKRASAKRTYRQMKKKSKTVKKTDENTRPYTWGDFNKLLKRAISTPPVRKPAPKSA